MLFLFDVLGYLKHLNAILQGKDLLVLELYAAVQTFKRNCWEQVTENKFTYVPTLRRKNVTCSATSNYNNILSEVRELSKHLKDFKKVGN